VADSSISDGQRAQAEVIRQYQISQLRGRLPIARERFEEAAIRLGTGGADSVDAEDLATLESAGPVTLSLSHYALTTDNEWDAFYNQLTFASEANHGPWRRTVTILRDHGVVGCVVERDYVCLDYRSEMASFYAQLNAPINSTSVRLHFFAADVSGADLSNLDTKIKDSYAGYVVCRSGNLPLVGRAVIRVPAYVDESAAIEESVHFLGQELRVRGVPFMQQDERFAICAQVAVWTAHYSAYRRGLVERRLIADFVALSSDYRPMRPHLASGLFPNQIATLFGATGLRSTAYVTPADLWDYPKVPLDAMQGISELIGEIDEALGELVQASRSSGSEPEQWTTRTLEERVGLLRNRDEDVTQYGADLIRLSRQPDVPTSRLASLADRLQDWIIDYLTAPYIRSRWPIYCGTADHALVLCGRTRTETGTVFFLHDDQYGPYLASRTVYQASKDCFQYQAYLDQNLDHDMVTAPREDRGKEILSGGGPEFTDTERTVSSLLIPGPPRLLLDPSAARLHAIDLIRRIQRTGAYESSARAQIMMGIDFKTQRRQTLLDSPNPARTARDIYSSLPLAEWVIVVEGVSESDGDSIWEAVYDGTSGSAYPILQFLRYRKSVVVTTNHDDGPQIAELGPGLIFPLLCVPSRIGKIV
jgi:hypothetical protein